MITNEFKNSLSKVQFILLCALFYFTLVLSILDSVAVAESHFVDFVGPINYEVGSIPSSLVAGKLKDNGNHFLALTTQGRDDVFIFLGNESGEFTGPTNYPSTVGPNSVAVEDFNGDGNSDLVVITDPFISLHFGDGAGGFPQLGGVFNGFAEGTAPTVGDFNGDGNLDVAVSIIGFSAISVVLGDGADGLSRFGNFIAYDTGYFSTIPSLAMGDIDRDGNVDLIAAKKGIAQITILWGDGTGRYFNRTSFAVGSSPNSVAVGDFNADGNPDIVSANQGSNNVSVLLGTGTRNLTDSIYLDVGSDPSSVAINDFNNDGNADIAVSNQSSNNVSILIGDGAGGFLNPINFDVGSGPITVAPGDFNGDGAIDLAVANAGSSNVSILLNTSDGSTPLVIVPGKGGDTGQVTVQIVGSGFVEGTIVTLKRLGEPDIIGNNLTVEGNSRITTIFDLTGKTLGLWDAVIINPGEDPIIFTESFTIEEGEEPQIWVDIVGHSVIRPGRPQTYHIFYGNHGNVDAYGIPLWISVPAEVEITPNFEVESLVPQNEDSIALNEVPLTVEVDGQTYFPLFIPKVSPGEASNLQVTLTLPPGHGAFSFKAWADDPLFYGSLLNIVNTSICIRKLLELVIPGLVCPASIGENLGNLIADIRYKEKIFSYPQAIGSLLGGCTNFDKAKLLLKIEDITTAIATGIDLGESCSDILPPLSPPGLPISPINSFDPNDKIGSQGVGEPRFLSGEEPLRYSVFFENLETATASAQEVIITDQLDTVNMNLDTLSLGPIAFGETIVTPPAGLNEFSTDIDLRPDNNLMVRVDANLNRNTGILTWQFISLDPETGELPDDPLAGFLPPSISPPEGDGNVVFTVMPKENLPTGTEIYNSASIVFDTNEPIITPEWFNTIDNSLPESEIVPLNSIQACTDFEVQWMGSDEGAGIKDYTIYVSENNGEAIPWLTNTEETAGTFSGANGKSYSFYSLARDHTGNVEKLPTESDAATKVSDGIDCNNNSITEFLEQFYENILGRASDTIGLNYWTNIIQDKSAAFVVQGFFYSQEFTGLSLNDEAFVDILYHTLFGREPDPGGKAYWLSKLQGGTLRDMVLYGFLHSKEFSDLSESYSVLALSDSDKALYQIKLFVVRFYELVLLRNPDVIGYNYWTEQLYTGAQSASEIAINFFFSVEFISYNHNDSTFVDIAYQTLLNRLADPGGKAYWLSQLASGLTRLELIQEFIGSPEFQAYESMLNISDTDANLAALNDTGITTCSDEDTNGLPCPVSGYPGQDAQYGRDVMHNDNSDGHAGFNFTKLNAIGDPLPATSTAWSCVRDNVTGLTWEVKTDDSGLQDKDNTYTWYNPDSNNNGGSAGIQNGGTCIGSDCDTQGYVQVVNTYGLCGVNDWHMPTIKELENIASLDRYSPAIDTDYFPNTTLLRYWSGSPVAHNSSYAWHVNVNGGGSYYGSYKSDAKYIRLVRSGQ